MYRDMTVQVYERFIYRYMSVRNKLLASFEEDSL